MRLRVPTHEFDGLPSRHIHSETWREKMIKTLTLALALGAAVLAPAAASAKSGGPGMGNQMGTRDPINVTQQRPQIDRPMIKSKVKLLDCHKHPRGNGQGGVIWVSVCT
jgi:hypothetical protein